MRRATAILASAMLLSACDAQTGGPADPVGAAGSLQAAVATATADVTGTWTYERELKLTLPPWAAELVFGLVPEGPVTHMACSGTGTLELVGDGASFSGTVASGPGECTTRGGQVPASGGASSVVIVDGVVHGHSISFTWLEDGYLPCPYQAVVSGDVMSGTGRCIIPGHPQSPVPANPPPGGTSKTVSFRATRN
jgi:hypothetical protein